MSQLFFFDNVKRKQKGFVDGGEYHYNTAQHSIILVVAVQLQHGWRGKIHYRQLSQNKRPACLSYLPQAFMAIISLSGNGGLDNIC